MSDIRIKPEEIVVDKKGRVKIKNEELTKAINKKLGKKESDVEGQADLFDRCTNVQCK